MTLKNVSRSSSSAFSTVMVLFGRQESQRGAEVEPRAKNSHVESIARAAPNVDIQQSVILEADPSRLLLNVVRDVLGLQPEAREANGSGGGELGSVGGVALLDRALVVVLEEHAVGNERVGGEADVVDDEVDVGGLRERERKGVSFRLGVRYEDGRGLTVNSTRGRGMV